jgi:glycosyltransferase involved in cell wall biosynthesis
MTTNKPIRVLLTVPHFSRTASPFRHMMAIAKYLPKDRFELKICSLRSNGHDEIEPILTGLGVPSFVARFRPRGRSPRHFWESIRDQAVINREGPFHIQHSLDFTPSPFEAIMARMKSRFYVYHQRNMNEEGSAMLLRMKIRMSNRIIAVSDAVREMLLRIGADAAKVKSISNGIDLDDSENYFLEGNSNGHGVILSVGQVVPRKRHEDAVRAFSILNKEMPQLRLQIAGKIVDPAYYQKLQDLVRELNLTDKVQFLGVRKDVLQLMQNADVLLHCADSEGFGWVILEAMTVGLPVVSSSVEGPKDIIHNGQTGYLVPMGETSGYVKAVKLLLNSPESSDLMRKKARESVELKFSAQTKVKELAGIYRDLVV